MFGHHKYPAYLADEHGVMPAAATPVEPREQGTWIAGWDGVFALIPAEGERSVHSWSDFETGSWDDDTNLLTLSFVDPSDEPLRLQIPREADGLVITMIRERIDRSIVYQQVAELPSGAIARGQVRRNPDDSLFTQIIIDADITALDQDALDMLETELRDAVGLE